MERIGGIEPPYMDWQTIALPLSYIRDGAGKSIAALIARRVKHASPGRLSSRTRDGEGGGIGYPQLAVRPPLCSRAHVLSMPRLHWLFG